MKDLFKAYESFVVDISRPKGGFITQVEGERVKKKNRKKKKGKKYEQRI